MKGWERKDLDQGLIHREETIVEEVEINSLRIMEPLKKKRTHSTTAPED
jgi:hypothetical protein